MLHYTLTTLQALACGYILFNSVLHLNRMEKATVHRIKLAYALLATAGGSGLMNCFLKAETLDTLFAVAVAMSLLFDRRKENADAGPTA